MKLGCLAMMTVALLFGAGAAAAQDEGDATAGLVFAERNCAECHDVVSRHPLTPKSRATSFHVAANKPGMSYMALLVWLQSDHPSMPNYILDPADMADVVAYIVSLKDK